MKKAPGLEFYMLEDAVVRCTRRMKDRRIDGWLNIGLACSRRTEHLKKGSRNTSLL